MPQFASPEEMAKFQLAEQEEAERDFHQRVEGARQEAERELFRFASAKTEEEAERMEPENNGDHSLEEPDEDIAGGVPEEEEQEEQQDEEQEDGGEDEDAGEQEAESDQPQRDERYERSVPSYRLREQTDRIQVLERQLAEMQMRMQQPQYPQQPQPVPQKPDMFVDPDAHTNWIMQQNAQASIVAFKEMTMAAAAEEYGDDFRYAYQTLQAGVQRGDPAANQTVQRIFASANPGRALMRWAEPLLQDLGQQRDDEWDQGYRDRYGREPPPRGQGQREIRREAVPPRRGVPSLNSAAGNGRQMYRERQAGGMEDDDRVIFNDIFENPRR